MSQQLIDLDLGTDAKILNLRADDLTLGGVLQPRVVHKGTWASRPTTGLTAGDIAVITDYGAAGRSEWFWNGTRWMRDSELEIYSNGLIDVSSSAVAETGLLTVVVKAGSLGPNGSLIWEFYETHTNNAANRAMRLRIGAGAWSTSHTQMWNNNVSTTTQSNGFAGFRNKNSESAQIARVVPFQFGLGPTTGTPSEATIDTTADFNVTFSVVSDGTQSLTLKHARVLIKSA